MSSDYHKRWWAHLDIFMLHFIFTTHLCQDLGAQFGWLGTYYFCFALWSNTRAVPFGNMSRQTKSQTFCWQSFIFVASTQLLSQWPLKNVHLMLELTCITISDNMKYILETHYCLWNVASQCWNAIFLAVLNKAATKAFLMIKRLIAWLIFN